MCLQPLPSDICRFDDLGSHQRATPPAFVNLSKGTGSNALNNVQRFELDHQIVIFVTHVITTGRNVIGDSSTRGRKVFENPYNVCMLVALGIIEWPPSPSIFCIRVRLGHAQKRHDTGMPLSGGQMKCRALVVVTLVNVWNHIQEQSNFFDISTSGGRDEIDRLVDTTCRCPFGSQELDNVNLVVSMRIIQGRPTPSVTSIDLGPLIDQKLHYYHMAFRRSNVQCCPSIVISKIHVRRMLDQELFNG
mmetsp:Transcript_23910/g.39553  ORF Transcript_23910/g.39553 Transcript_23910/m.39553 type:complete len:247 (-) Transcript_23910:593-1333(-)